MCLWMLATQGTGCLKRISSMICFLNVLTYNLKARRNTVCMILITPAYTKKKLTESPVFADT